MLVGSPFRKKKCTRYIYTFNVFENPFFTVVKKRRATENDRTPVQIQRFYTVARPTRATLAVPGINTTNENISFCFLFFFPYTTVADTGETGQTDQPWYHRANHPHQLCHGNSSEDFSRVLLEGSANASKDASNTFEAPSKPSLANVTADLAAVASNRQQTGAERAGYYEKH